MDNNNATKNTKTQTGELVSVSPAENKVTVSRPQNRFIAILLESYDPRPMVKPRIADDWQGYGRLERIAEALRFCLARSLYALSPGGGLQAWWRLIVRSLLVVTPLMMALYAVAVMLALLLFQVQMAAHSICMIAIYILIASVCVVLTYSIFAVFFKVISMRHRVG